MGQFTGWRSLRRLFQEQEKENEGSQQDGGRHHPVCQAVLAADVPFSGGICSKTPTTQSCAAVTIQRVDIWYGMMTLQTYSYELCGDSQRHPLVAFNTTQLSSWDGDLKMWKLTDYCYGVVCTGHLLKDVRSYKKVDLISTPALGKQSVFRRSASGCWAYGPFDLKHRRALQNGESWTRGRLLCPLAVCSYRHCYENTHTHSVRSCLPCVFLRIYLDSRCF